MNVQETVESLARQAGAIALAEAGSLVVASKNGDYRNVVTNIDIKISEQLRQKISEQFPDDAFYSEEAPGELSEAGRTWVIDPIDGTSNYARSLPLYSSCVTALEAGQVIATAIYSPRLDESFTLGESGSMLNGEVITTAPTDTLKQAYVNFHTGRKQEYRQWAGDTKIALLGAAKKSFDTSSSALDLCYLAAGRTDIVVYGSLTTLDIAGAIAIVRAAGGEVYNYDTKEPVEFLPTSQRIIAVANEALLTEYYTHITTT